MRMDSRGNIAAEIALVLIIVVLIAGTVLTAFENSTEKVVTMQERQNMKTMSSQLVDNLINNPGVPDNWHEYGSGTPGLAVQNEGNETIPNSVSYGKFIALGGNYKKLIYEKYFNSKIESSMELIPLESTISSVKIGSEKTSDNIYSANRLVKCDFFKKYVINMF
jgi:archaellum component FlaG (FlaF/FlaG flagellin family)